MPVSERVRAVAVHPGTPHSLHMTTLELPSLGPDDVRVRVIRAGVCGTDREIIEAKFGSAPDDCAELVIGHEMIGVVEQVGANVSDYVPGDYVTATARRSCGCPECAAGVSDFCRTLAYKERGIIGLHGYWTEQFVEHAANLIHIPAELEPTGVLVEPLSVPEKVWRVANAVQARIGTWQPHTAAVFGAGPIGLLTTLVLRARGLDVYTLDLDPAPNPKHRIVEQSGAVYVPTAERAPLQLKRDIPNVDLIVECTGSSAPLADAMQLLGNNGVLVLLSVTAGGRVREIPADAINFEFVLGNKVMAGSVNSSLADFRAAVEDLQRIEHLWPGLAGSLITHRLHGLEAALQLPGAAAGAIKAVIDL